MKVSVLGLITGLVLAMSLPCYAEVKSVVLVHGAFADGSGWKPVADILARDGYSVRVVQEPETTFAADLAATQRVLDKAGPSVLAGHSYGGMIITEVGSHANARALVYIAAFLPEVGETAGGLQNKIPPATKGIGPVGDGFVAVDPEVFPNDFASGVPKDVARFMAISQVPIAGEIFDAKVTRAAWKDKPSSAVIPAEDRMINPELHRFMTKRAGAETIELPGGHAVFLSHASDVAALIEKAAKAAK
jgi:pimeloyl-ACP methyl ester carboxylesterase